ncbi:hypothetical protein N0609_12025 [Pseudomonas aeruginosa]|nr:hypothetical protein [Pseudomonas aeruginosa]MCS8510279.1 hypothetical protein [Pseudomonas aeruginosa]MCS8541213.1 hypothetical protein [Pseudomonas aeruginosa]MCT0600359.1 hypothetical protein [Pseudomonas aeruginosa]
MQVTHTRKSFLYTSWDSGDKTTLTVAITADGVSLHHIDRGYLNSQSTMLNLSADEAADVAARIERVLRGEAPQNRLDEPGAKLVVTQATDGDPYREGVSLALDDGGAWDQQFDFQMEKGSASSLAAILRAAQA